MSDPKPHYPTDDDATEAIFYLMGDLGYTNIRIEQQNSGRWHGYVVTGEKDDGERWVAAVTLKQLASRVETLYLHGWL